MSSGGTMPPKRHELRGSLVGGLIAALGFFGTVIFVGQIGSFQALGLIEGVLPTARFLGSTVVASSVTVLALLLTLLGLSLTSEYSFDPRLYARAGYITTLSVITLALGVTLLLIVTVPVQEVEELRPHYAVLYYALAGIMATLGGLVVAIGLLIGATLRGLIGIVHPEGVSDLVVQEEGTLEEGAPTP